MTMHHSILLMGPVAVLAACTGPAPVPPPQPPSGPALVPAPPRPAPTPLAQTNASWTERALTPGVWIWRDDGRGAVALYGPAGQDAVLVVRCDRAATRIYVSRPSPTAGRMTLVASNGLRAYPSALAGGSPAYAAAAIDVRDPQLDAIAYSRGRFMVALEGAADVIVPAWPEVTRTIEECRN